MITTLLLLATAATTTTRNARTEPETCAVAATSHGKPAGKWAGGCRAGRAEGPGAMRIDGPNGRGVFAGRATCGRPTSGVTTLEDGALFPLAPTPTNAPRYMDAASMATDKAFRNAFDGAAAASNAYARAGNAASARYYRDLRAKLLNGQPE